MTSDSNPATAHPSMTDAEWGDLLDGIERQKCLVVVGPEVYTADGQPTTEKRLAEHLQRQAAPLRIRVYDNGWFHLLPMGNESSPVRQVKEFYNQPNPQAEATLRKLAGIRFPILLSINPDDKLRRAFDGYPATFENYVRNQPYREDLEPPTADRPVVFNLLGHLEDRNSLVLTYDDFYDYLRSVFTGNSMSPILKDAILKAEYFLFLGIPFDQWYMHLFMRILRQHKEKRQTQKFAVPYPDNADSCSEQYTIRFVDNRITAFVDELCRRCEQHPGKARLLRPAPAVKGEAATDDDRPEQFFTLLMELLAERRFDDIYDSVKKVLAGSGEGGKRLLGNFIQLKGRHADLKEQNSLGLLLPNELIVEMNKLSKSFLDQINELRKQWNQLNIQL